MLRHSSLRRRAAALSAGLVAALPLALVTSPARAADVVGGPTLASTKVVVTLGPDADPLPKVGAESWVLADLDTGEVLAAKNAHRQGRPASTIKTLTALTLMRVLDKDAVHTATWAEARADGGRVGIVPDAEYTIWDLYHALLLPSGNDAAAALADANGGMRKTVRDMQAVADDLQANDTVVKNSSGLDADGMVTSAYDLALIARAALEEEQFAEVTAALRYDFPGRPNSKGVQKTYKIYTQNRLLLHGYKGAIGGKTGWTTKAGRTFWGAAERGDRRLVVTILQSKDRTEAVAKALLTWGFANASKVTPVGTLVEPLSSQPQPPAVDPGASASPAAAGGAAAPTTATTASGGGTSTWVLLAVAVLAALAGGAWLLRGRGRAEPAVALPGPVGAAPAPAAPVVPAPVQPEAAPKPATPRAPAPTVPTTGHVKVIAPPSRPPRG